MLMCDKPVCNGAGGWLWLTSKSGSYRRLAVTRFALGMPGSVSIGLRRCFRLDTRSFPPGPLKWSGTGPAKQCAVPGPFGSEPNVGCAGS